MAEWTGDDFERSGIETIRRLARYLDESREGTGPVVSLRSPAELAAELDLPRLIREGGLGDELPSFLERYLAGTTRLHHPGSLAHQVAAPHPLSAIADLVHGLTNNPMAIWEMGPPAAAIELALLDWMLGKAGFGPGGTGVLTHGGSLGNLTALLAARAAAAPEAWDQGTHGDLVVLAPPSAHYSIGRAVAMLGLGARALRPLPVDGREVVVAEGLSGAIASARAEGKRIVAVVASAAATSTGLFDPIGAMADVCRAEGVWLHVDGAHGATALLSPRDRVLMAGVERADSLTWDAHKMLRTSAVATALLVRDGGALASAFRQEAPYLFYGDDPGGVDLIHRTVECTKAELGLKLLFAVAAGGEAALARHWEERSDAARRFAALIAARPGFECPFPPQSNIVLFRRRGDDARQVALRDALLREGRFHVSSTEVSGRRWLRLAVMNAATGEATVAALLDAVERLDAP